MIHLACCCSQTIWSDFPRVTPSNYRLHTPRDRMYSLVFLPPYYRYLLVRTLSSWRKISLCGVLFSQSNDRSFSSSWKRRTGHRWAVGKMWMEKLLERKYYHHHYCHHHTDMTPLSHRNHSGCSHAYTPDNDLDDNHPPKLEPQDYTLAVRDSSHLTMSWWLLLLPTKEDKTMQ